MTNLKEFLMTINRRKQTKQEKKSWLVKTVTIVVVVLKVKVRGLRMVVVTVEVS